MSTYTTNLNLLEKNPLTEGSDTFNIQSMMNDNWDKIDSYVGLLAASLAPPYSSSSSYAVGDLCTHGGSLYKNNTPIGSGGEAWNSSHWTAVDVKTLLAAIQDALAEKKMAWYGECSTAAGTQQKDVTITGITALTAGLAVRVKFANAQSYNGQPKLKVNSLDAKNIVRKGTTAAAQYEWDAGEVVDFVYDGTSWVMTNGAIASTTYYGMTKLSSSTSSTSTSLAATASAVKAVNDRITYGASDLTAGTSALTTGVFYAYYT